MIKKALVIHPDGHEESLENQPSLLEVRKIVEGYVEVIPTIFCKDTTVTMALGNEDGRLIGLTKNPKASSLLNYNVVGNIVILKGWRDLK